MRSDDELEKSIYDWIKIDLLRFGCRAPYRTKFPGNVPRSEKEGKHSTTEFERSIGCKRRLSSSRSTPAPSSTKVDAWVGRILPLPPPIHTPRRHMRSTCRWFGVCRGRTPGDLNLISLGEFASVKTLHRHLSMEKDQCYCQHRHLLINLLTYSPPSMK